MNITPDTVEAAKRAEPKLAGVPRGVSGVPLYVLLVLGGVPLLVVDVSWNSSTRNVMRIT